MVKQPVSQLPAGYGEFLNALKARIRAAQVRAALTANRGLIHLYWQIGKGIAERQERQGWGQGVVERLSADLCREFPEMKGFSTRNLWEMRRFYQCYRGQPILQQLVAEIPWGHNLVILSAVKEPVQRLWYVQQSVQHGWSRNILSLQIATDLYARQGKAVTNFRRTLPPPHSDLAHQTLKDPYVFDFLTVGKDAHERAVERELVEHITRVLLELGAGFAFVGEQYRVEVSEQDFFIDLLFYHTRLHCYVAVEIKAGAFRPEHAGKINFYLSALDDQLKAADDNPSIGLILCATKDKLTAEYALRDIHKPIGVAEWQTQLTRSLPADLRTSLPTIEELEAELERTAASPAPAKTARRQGKARRGTPTKSRDPG